MGRSRKDQLTVDGSTDRAPVPADVEDEEMEDAVEEQSQEEQHEEQQEEHGDGEEDGEEGEEEQEDGEEAPKDAAEQERDGSPPKLAEGYFEIEAIRRRRRCRGQLQYLIKWRGWPETANTWEPFENLKACSDIIDDFEKRSRDPWSSRKRKRKTTTTPTSDPTPSRGKRGRPPQSEARSLPRTPAVARGGQVIGAKKRKSGSITRFKPDEATQEQGDHNARESEKPDNANVGSLEGDIMDKNKGVEAPNHITKIIKPVRYLASTMNGVQQVSIMFRAHRANGQEVLVDDKELKDKYPLLLIDYYEQHICFNQTS